MLVSLLIFFSFIGMTSLFVCLPRQFVASSINTVVFLLTFFKFLLFLCSYGAIAVNGCCYDFLFAPFMYSASSWINVIFNAGGSSSYFVVVWHVLNRRHYHLFIRVFHTSVSWSYTEDWVTANFLKSPGLFSVSWPFSIM